MATLQFLGATGTVTGSKYLLTTDSERALVDCGLFQGLKELRRRNWDPFPADPESIHRVLLTHAHIDHVGYLPKLRKGGFSGEIWGTTPTTEICRLVLPDSGHLQEEEAKFANKKGYSKHSPALPLYTEKEAQEVLPLLKPVEYEKEYVLAEGVTCRYRDAGHILGSSTILISLKNQSPPITILFSGDLGRYGAPILRDPASVPEADYILLESTYGNRAHGTEDREEALASIIAETVKRGGTIVIPAFAVGRTQDLLYDLRILEDSRRIPILPVYMDRPMATSASEILARHPEYYDEEATALNNKGRNHIWPSNLHWCSTQQESKAVNQVTSPCVIIAASGMATGGRVLHHLKHRMTDPKNTLLFVGFQAQGTRGRLMLEGAKKIKIHGEEVPVKAQIQKIDSFSAHADYKEILRWVGGFTRPPKKAFIVHGEPEASQALAEKLRESVGWKCHIPAYLEAVLLE
ncbi:MAG: MBL fold metallo-hydrolase [Armatimonadetes bacterium]|nr:MBL fold metallo-hydrolase [Armatimonadota bacterium]